MISGKMIVFPVFVCILKNSLKIFYSVWSNVKWKKIKFQKQQTHHRNPPQTTIGKPINPTNPQTHHHSKPTITTNPQTHHESIFRNAIKPTNPLTRKIKQKWKTKNGRRLQIGRNRWRTTATTRRPPANHHRDPPGIKPQTTTRDPLEQKPTTLTHRKPVTHQK